MVTNPWADEPFELIPTSRAGVKKGEKAKDYRFLAQEMIIIHNVLLRGINSIYLQCVNVERSPEVVMDFVNYASQWGDSVHEHHETEEVMVFPQLEELLEAPGLMAANVAQHEAFHSGLDSFQAYIKAVLGGSEKYDGKKLRAIIDSFMPTLRQHLSDEIDTLLALEKYNDKVDIHGWFEGVVKKIMDKQNDPNLKYTVIPFAFLAHDKTFDDGALAYWPELPWIAKMMFNWLFIPRNKKWWVFAPCDVYGKPKELPYSA